MLQELASHLAIPGLPDWVGLVLLLLGMLVALAYLLMPFSVFGVKGRLEAIEAHLDEIQTEIRSLALRLPEPSHRRRGPPVEDDWVAPPTAQSRRYGSRDEPPRATPPIPPPASWPEHHRYDRGGRSVDGDRAEPRLDWPRGGG